MIGSLAYPLSTMNLRHGRLVEVFDLYQAHRQEVVYSFNDNHLALVHDALWRREELLLTGAMHSDVYDGGW